MDKSDYWQRPTRYLHLGLVLTVTAQLLLSLVMATPHGDRLRSALQTGSFAVHEWVGMSTLVIVILHWLWSLRIHHAASLGHLFPWRGTGRRQVIGELRALLQGRLPKDETQGGLAGLVHGLGLLAVTAIAISGGVLFFLIPENGLPASDTVHNLGDIHSFIATFVWLYWGAHIAMALLHHVLGHDTLRRIFKP